MSATEANTVAPGVETRRPVARGSRIERMPSWLLILASAVVLVAIWQVVVSAGWVSEFILPAPADTGTALVDAIQSLVTGGDVWSNFLVTLQETVIGMILASVVGILLGVVIAETAFGRKVIQPLMIAVYAAPKVALAPVFVAWFGFGTAPKIVMAATIAFFPVMVDTAAGLAGVDEDQTKLFRVVRANRMQQFWKLKLPTALPFIFSGLKSASVLAIIGAIVAEFMGGGDGLGVLIKTASVSFSLDRVFALIILLSAMAFVIYLIVGALEKRLVTWRSTEGLPSE